MLLYLVEYEVSPNMEVEEYEELEKEVLKNGYWNVMNSDQLADILDNMKMKKPDFSDIELEHAINYYSKHDNFMELNNA